MQTPELWHGDGVRALEVKLAPGWGRHGGEWHLLRHLAGTRWSVADPQRDVRDRNLPRPRLLWLVIEESRARSNPQVVRRG
jgi:hypothetical protein